LLENFAGIYASPLLGFPRPDLLDGFLDDIAEVLLD
jgi:hypothetical protein